MCCIQPASDADDALASGPLGATDDRRRVVGGANIWRMRNRNVASRFGMGGWSRAPLAPDRCESIETRFTAADGCVDCPDAVITVSGPITTPCDGVCPSLALICDTGRDGLPPPPPAPAPAPAQQPAEPAPSEPAVGASDSHTEQ